MHVYIESISFELKIYESQALNKFYNTVIQSMLRHVNFTGLYLEYKIDYL